MRISYEICRHYLYHPSHHPHHRLAFHQGETEQLLAQVFERGTERVKACVVKQKKTVVDRGYIAYFVCFPIIGSCFQNGND